MTIKKEIKKIDWDQIIKAPKVSEEWWTGRQVLNFYPFDKDYRDSQRAQEVVKKYFSHAKPLNTDAGLLKYGSDQATLEGAYLEMGVCTGRTINFIAALNPERIIYGFDSFEGLPEKWDRSDAEVPQGTFAMKNNQLPTVLHNVKLVKGLFKDTLPKFKQTILKNIPVAFLHIDVDIYSSTKDVLDILEDHIVPGTIIVFDEFYNYEGYDRNEFKAFQEFLKKSKRKANYLAYNQYFEQVAIRIE